jgi:hypothetical protein
MTKRERVIAALAGREVDRGSTRLLMHNFASENSARGLAAETLRLARTFDRDYLKPQSRAVVRGDVGSHVSSVDRTCDSRRMTFMLRQRAALSLKAGSLVGEYGTF